MGREGGYALAMKTMTELREGRSKGETAGATEPLEIHRGGGASPAACHDSPPSQKSQRRYGVWFREGFDPTFGKKRKPSFDKAPASAQRQVFGVDYLHLCGLQRGDLFVTHPGWPFVQSLLPSQWFTRGGGDSFTKPGQALAGPTGAVYKVDVPHPARKRLLAHRQVKPGSPGGGSDFWPMCG